MYQSKVREINYERDLKLYEDPQCSVQKMILHFFGFTFDFWEQSPANEGPITLELLVTKLHRNPCYYRLQLILFMFLNQNVQFDSFLVFTSQDYSMYVQ
jgi:hypothetical protein